MSRPDVVIVGAGLAGLCCAKSLQKHSISFEILEASDGVGGRVRTDNVDGFLLDRGFQVLLTAYPEAREQLNYEALRLRAFAQGVVVRYHGKFVQFGNPWRNAWSLVGALIAPLGSIADKCRLAKLHHDLGNKSIAEIFASEETTTLQALRCRGFSPRILESFFKPFLGGVLLDSKLMASSRMFEFAFKMFADGDAVLPAAGIGAIPEQIASSLPAGTIRLDARVKSLEQGVAVLESGEAVHAKAIVVATDGTEASRLLESSRNVNARSVSVLYFSAPVPPFSEPMLVVNGGGRGPVNHVCIPSLVQPTYAPPGSCLVSASVLGWPTSDDKLLEDIVRTQMQRWYGAMASEWRLIRVYRIPHAHPLRFPMEWQQPCRLSDGIYVSGDHRSTPSIQGAMESGRLAAEAVLQDFGFASKPVETPELATPGKARGAAAGADGKA